MPGRLLERFVQASPIHLGKSDNKFMPPGENRHKNVSLNLRISALEADLAYFEARLQLIGEPETPHQRAQVKTYQSLETSLKNILVVLRRESKQHGREANGPSELHYLTDWPSGS